MYIDNSGRSYYRRTEQCSSRTPFLILMQPDDESPKRNNIRGIIRKVAMQQLGHWMMGKARIGGETVILSGCYGSDGLPKDVPRELWERGTPLPDELYDQWAKGGGWNSAGSEGSAMREWGLTLQKRNLG